MFPGPMDYDAAMTVGALVLVALAAREDLVRNRVPNTLNGAALLIALVLGVAAGGAEGLLNSAGGALAGCAALLPFYLLRGMGAGDVKLMAAAGAFLGPGAALLAAALSLIAGGVLALAYVAWRLVQPRASWAASLAAGHALPPSTAAATSKANATPSHRCKPWGFNISLRLTTAPRHSTRREEPRQAKPFTAQGRADRAIRRTEPAVRPDRTEA